MSSMVQVVENRSVAVLTPLSDPETGPAPGWVICRVRVDEAGRVEGYPNLLAAALPCELDALVPEPQADLIVVHRSVRLVVSLTGPGRLRVEPGEAHEVDDSQA